MPVDRPTFSESWHRVAKLKPRLRATVQTYRQHFRGEPWYVVQDRASNQYFRLSEPAYHLMGLLDGRRTVSEAWQLSNEHLGDEAPTQGEAIELLGQLYSANLIQAELAADAEGMFKRYRKRVRREVRNYLTNFLFIRIPLFDPDRMLTRWLPACGWWFSPMGVALWTLLLAVGVWHLIGRGGELLAGAGEILEVENLVLLYLCFGVTKALHEFGHGIACKRFGQSAGGGEVHVVGIMILVFMPVPYVDASSAWAFRSRWQRAFVGAAGIYVEIAIAAIAAVVWARTGSGTLANALAYNVMFIASVSTVLFNGNPLLRFDAYYILSDILEIPNLSNRGRDYFYYLVKRYVYSVRRPKSPARSARDRVWLLSYHLAATAYRIVICFSILMFIASFFLVVALFLGMAVIITWLIVPLGKWMNYLATHQELARTRTRSVFASTACVATIVAMIMVPPLPDRSRSLGVVEPRYFVMLNANEFGFIEHVHNDGASVQPGEAIFTAHSYQLESELAQLRAQLRAITINLEKAEGEDPAVAQMYSEQRDVLGQRLARIEQRVDSLQVKAPIAGVWMRQDRDLIPGTYARRGQPLGIVASPDDLIVRLTADQRLGPRVGSELQADQQVEMRVHGRPDLKLRGTVERVLPAGQMQLPSAALGYLGGGPMAVKGDDPDGLTAARQFFEIRIAAHPTADNPPLLSGQRVMVRFEFEPKPLGEQLWRAFLRLLQQGL